MKTPRYTLYVSDADLDQLQKHPGLNRSALFHAALARYFREECDCPVHGPHRRASGDDKPVLARDE